MVIDNDDIVRLLKNQVRKNLEDSRINEGFFCGNYPAVSSIVAHEATCAGWIGYIFNLTEEKREVSYLDDVRLVDAYKHFPPKFEV
jgi:hypothetical protein